MVREQSSDTTSNVIVGILIGLVVVLVGLLTLSNRERISSLFSENKNDAETISGSTSEEFFVGKEIAFRGHIEVIGDLTTYTHTFTRDDGVVFGLKSTTILLDKFISEVMLGGVISDYKNEMYIIAVSSVVPTKTVATGEISRETNNTLTGVSYFVEAGMKIKDLTDVGIQASHDEINKKITFIQNGAGSGKTMTILYFGCDTSNALTDCGSIEKSMKETSPAPDYITAQGDEFYRIPETSSWFGTIDNTYGYYLETEDKVFLVEAMNYITFVSTRYLTSILGEKAKDLCQEKEAAFYEIKEISFVQENKKIKAIVLGNDAGKTKEITCILEVDLTLEQGGVVKSTTIKDTESLSGSSISSGSNLSSGIHATTEIESELTTQGATLPRTKDERVEQFPLTLDKTLTYESSKQGFSIVFPSKNIQFEGANIKEDFGEPGLSCYSVINVIDYTNKDAVNTSPTVQIYTCSYKKSILDTLRANYRIQEDATNERIFLTALKDPSRYDFATNVVITLPTE